MSGPPPYSSNREHLEAELERTLLMTRLEYERLKAREPARFEDNFRGLRITATEVEAALAPGPASGPAPAAPVLEELERLEAEIAARGRASLAAGVELRLEKAASLFGLDPVSRDCLLICLGPELDLRLAKIYAYLQDDITKRLPRVHLVLDLLRIGGPERLEARRLFHADAPLVRHRLLRLLDPGAPLLARSLQIEARVADYLLGVEGFEPALAAAAAEAVRQDRLAELVLPAALGKQLERVAAALAEGGTRLPVLLCGLAGTGKKTAAASLCTRSGRPLLLCDLGRLGWGQEMDELMPLLLREARLREAAIYLDGIEAAAAPEAQGAWEGLVQAIEAFPYPVFLGCNTAEAPAWLHLACLPLRFPLPSYGEGALIWQAALGERPEAALLANKFRLTGAQVREAIERAQGLSLIEGEAEPSAGSLHRACRRASNARLSQLAKRIAPRYGWDDIVLPEDARAQLGEMCDQMRHRCEVYERWGFGKTAPRGKGLCALFVGESGTGKTMAAEIMAAELGLDLYKIDLSSVVSKYIGETEKNLERIFSEAQHSNAILFFDEADAVFGKRSEVKDAHDRYANIEISYLLQRMEDYEGIVILASNLRANIDDAFMRRMQFVVEFPFPEEDDRLAIWRKVFPAQAPGAADLDLATLAAQLKIAGGNIRNIAVTTAFLAAADGARLNMGHVQHAVRREFQKMGRLRLKPELEAARPAHRRPDTGGSSDEENRLRGRQG